MGISETVKAWVREARTNAGLTQSELGEKLGLTKGNISSWEVGRHQPSIGQLLKIGKICHAPLPPDLSTEATGSDSLPPDVVIIAQDLANLPKQARLAIKRQIELEKIAIEKSARVSIHVVERDRSENATLPADQQELLDLYRQLPVEARAKARLEVASLLDEAELLEKHRTAADPQAQEPSGTS